jgi:DnaD/phage-associated family protein
MVRFLHLSMGSQVGANGVAMIAVLELKRMLQHPAGVREQSGASPCIVRLTSEEWRTVAGIHERKAFERAKARLLELEVLQIERKGRLLEVTLWPDPKVEEEDATADPVGDSTESTRITDETSTETSNETSNETSSGTSYGTSSETELGTPRGTSRETCLGTGFATSPERETSSETASVSLSERVLRSREDEVFPRPDVTKTVAYPTLLDKPALLRYPLNRQYKDNYSTINNVNNGETNNEQRYNEQRSNESRASPPPKELSLLEFAIHWVEEVGHPMTFYEKEGLVRFMRLGYTEELFVEALRCAVAADNRRMGYVLGILRNWYQQGVRCLKDVAEVKNSWEDLRFLKRAKNS